MTGGLVLISRKRGSPNTLLFSLWMFLDIKDSKAAFFMPPYCDVENLC